MLAIVLFLASEPKIIAQSRRSLDFEIRRLTLRDGMVNQTIHALGTDHAGVLWIGTLRGLFTFDGVCLEQFTAQKIPNFPAPTLLVTALETDTGDSNLIFVGTLSGVIAIDPIERKAVPDTTLGLPAGFLRTCTLIEKSTGGYYWLLSRQTLYKMFKSESKKYSYQLVHTLPHAEIYNLTADPVNPEGLWVLPLRSEVYYLKEQGLQHYSMPPNRANRSPTPDLVSWLFTEKGIFGWDHARNIYRFNQWENRIELLNGQYNLYDFLPDLERVDHYLERKATLTCYATILAEQQLFGTDLGLFIVRKKSKDSRLSNH